MWLLSVSLAELVCLNGPAAISRRLPVSSSPTRKGLPSLFLVSLAGVIGSNAFAAGKQVNLKRTDCRFQVIEFL